MISGSIICDHGFFSELMAKIFGTKVMQNFICHDSFVKREQRLYIEPFTIPTVLMLRRCLEKLLRKVPPTQAAYQQVRSTKELVFTFKVLAEKAITSENYKIILLLVDMSKAFDTVRRSELFNILEEVLEKDELHMMKILIEDVSLRVRIGKSIGNEINTNEGVPQGDCLSPILFIVYLA